MAVPVPKSYFLATDLSLPPDGPLRLGSILSRPSDGLSILNRDNYIPVPDQDVSPPVIQTNFRSISRSTDSSGMSLWAKFLQVQGLAGVDNSTIVKTGFSCKELATLSFFPKDDYVKEAVDSAPVQKYLSGGLLSRPVYLVTGLKIARGVQQEVSRSKHSEIGGRVAVDIGNVTLGVPVGNEVSVAGLEALSGSKAGQRMLLGGSSDFIFAYRVRKITFRKRKQTEDEGAAFRLHQPDNEVMRSNLIDRDRTFEPTPVLAKDDETAPDETQPVRILCLDGGGVRGISSLCMLRELMLEVGAEKQRQSE